MHLATLVCFYISAVSAVKHYGIMPSEDMHSMIEKQAQQLLNFDMTLASVFTTDSHHTHDGFDFLSSELGIFNKTVYDIFTSSTDGSDESAIEARAAINGQCQGHGRIEDNLSKDQITQLCIGMNGAATTGVAAIIHVIESKVCVEAGTGHPLDSCKTIFGMIKISGGTVTTLEISNYCSDFLSFFVKCKGADGKAYAENKKLEMTAFNSQKDYDCKKANNGGDKCIETTVS